MFTAQQIPANFSLFRKLDFTLFAGPELLERVFTITHDFQSDLVLP